ncbi:MAG: hypothetical protein OXF66_04055 [Gammaproteobacteria bacterium]|nr:hypothetical protein [Gammaproteobacteria bacterium]MCY4165860.1 hypothetical protein [Gammaproteobacteria bacterium]MCY4339966.1 hypothetical protein [Gammaproteobacteria bacterium]
MRQKRKLAYGTVLVFLLVAATGWLFSIFFGFFLVEELYRDGLLKREWIAHRATAAFMDIAFLAGGLGIAWFFVGRKKSFWR